MSASTSETRHDTLIRLLPKTETHLHIEGALPWELLQQLDPERFSAPPASWQDDHRFSSFAEFETQLLDMAFSWYTSPERYHEAAKLIFRRHLESNIRYVETSFASGVIEFLGLDGRAVLDAIQSAVPESMEVRVFLGIHHNGYNERTAQILDAACDWDGLSGFDLHGDETLPLEEWTARLWKRAADAGKTNKVHAGELLGSDFVRRVIHEIRPARIQHGVRAAEDDEVVALLRDEGIALDVCPISNAKLGVCPSLAEHPLPTLEAGGVRCTLSTDDPLVFGNTLEEEYRVVAEHLNYGPADLARLASNGWRVALIDEADRTLYLDEIRQLLERSSSERTS